MFVLTIIYKLINESIARIRDVFFNVFFKLSLSLQGASYGKGIKTYGGLPRVLLNRKHGIVHFGLHTMFNNFHSVGWNSKCYIRVEKNASLVVGDYSGINGVAICCSQEIRIGKYVKIGGGTCISDSNHHSLDYKERRLDSDLTKIRMAKIVIEDDVFIGAGCYIGKGVSIGARSIIAQGSVVVKDIPSDCIAGGNPCKVIKQINKND